VTKISSGFLTSISVIAICLTAGISLPASAFSTYKVFGGAVHKAIIFDALAPHGLSKAALDAITRGCNSQDNPKSANFSIPQRHACDDKIEETDAFIRRTVDESVSLADGALKSKSARKQALYRFGEALHALQDFYSHSNYLELLIRDKKLLEPFDWQNPPTSVVTCYYHYASTLHQEFFEGRQTAVRALLGDNPALCFHSQEEYNERRAGDASEDKVLDYALAPLSFTHLELNKDNEKTLEGRVVSSTYKKTYHQLAKELAAKDTSLLWQRFEKLLRDSYSEKKTPGQAENILEALKQLADDPVELSREDGKQEDSHYHSEPHPEKKFKDKDKHQPGSSGRTIMDQKL
jgi:hypothetical protein